LHANLSFHFGGELVPTRSIGTQVLDAERLVFGSNAEHWSQLAKTCPKTVMLPALHANLSFKGCGFTIKKLVVIQSKSKV
jgi:hypothetical protein